MGGLKANRTKGNVRPTNSARIANMFVDSMPSNPITFTSLASTSEKNDDLPELDHEITATIRRLSKKCPQTRLNALRDLLSLFESRDETSFVAIIPLWARAFVKLSTEENDEVRLASIRAHARLVEKAGRQLAPFLKNLLWPWLVLMHDHSRAVRSASVEVFDSVFSPDKQLRVFEFSRDQLLEQTLESLTTAFPTAKSPHTVSHLHVACAALQVLRSLLQRLPSDEKLESHFQLLFRLDRFWSFSTHAHYPLQCAWFSLMDSILQIRPSTLITYNNQLTNTINACLDKYQSKTTHESASNIDSIWVLAIHLVEAHRVVPFPANRVNAFLVQVRKHFENPAQISSVLLHNLPDFCANLCDIIKVTCGKPSTTTQQIVASFSKGLCSVSLFTSDCDRLFSAFFNLLQTILEEPNRFDFSLSQTFDLISDCLKHLLPVRLVDPQLKVTYSFAIHFGHFIEFLYPKMPNTALVFPVTEYIENAIESRAQFKEFSVWLYYQFQRPSAFVRHSSKALEQAVGRIDPVMLSTDQVESYQWIFLECKKHVLNQIESNSEFEFWMLVKRLIDIGGQLSNSFELEDVHRMRKTIIDLLNQNLEDNFCSLLVAAFLSLVTHKLIPTDDIKSILQTSNSSVLQCSLRQISQNKTSSFTGFVHHNMAELLSSAVKRFAVSHPDNIVEFKHNEIELWFDFLSSYDSLNLLFDAIHHVSKNVQVPLTSKLIQKLVDTSNDGEELNLSIDRLLATCLDHNNLIENEYLDHLLELLITLVRISKRFDWHPLIKLNELIEGKLIDLETNELICHKMENLLHQLIEEDVSCTGKVLETLLQLSNTNTPYPNDLLYNRWVTTTIVSHQFDSTFDLNCLSTRIPKPLLISIFSVRLLNVYLSTEQVEIKNELAVKKLKVICESIGYTEVLQHLFSLQTRDLGNISSKLVLLEHLQVAFKQLQSLVKVQHLNELLRQSIQPTENPLWLWSGIRLLINNRNNLDVIFDHDHTELDLNHFYLFAQYFEQKYIQSQFDRLKFAIPRFNFNQPLSESNINDLFTLSSIVSSSDISGQIEPLLRRLASIDFVSIIKNQSTNFFNLLPLLQTLITRLFDSFKDTLFEFANRLTDCAVEYWRNLKPAQYDSTTIGLIVRFCQLMLAINDRLRTDDKFSDQLKVWQEKHVSCLLRVQFRSFILFNKEENPIAMELPIRLMGQCLAQIKPECLIGHAVSVPRPLQTAPIQQAVEYVIFSKPLDELVRSLIRMFEGRPVERYAALSIALQNLDSYPSQLQVTNLLESDEDIPLQPPNWLLEPLQRLDSTLKLLLDDYTVGRVVCEFATGSDSQQVALSYLALWRLFLKLHQLLPSDQRPRLLALLSSIGLLDHLFDTLFRLMPLQFDLCPDSIGRLFEAPFQISVALVGGRQHVQHAACDLYTRALRQLPASARLWLQRQERPLQTHVLELTERFVSPLLIAEELKTVQEQAQQPNQTLKLRTRPQAREVLGTYVIEEASIELSVRLAPRHPLEPVTIDGGKRVGVDAVTWRTWLLQLTAFLTQNGTIYDGLRLWTRNLSRRFEGVDECMICFYVLHFLNQQLPRISCRKCRKKFHSACLNKWFTSSKNRSCPLCRTDFV